MKLISLTANKETFHPIYFHDGINIIVGKQITPTNKNDGNTYNGVGKSLILHLIHFCLGARKISSFEEKIPDWEFTLNFIIDNKNYSCKRSTSKQNSIEFNGECLKPAILQEKLLKLCFGKTHTPQNMTWNTLFSRFVRRYRSSYTTFDTYVPKESDYSKILNNCYLLGINTQFIVEKNELREQQTKATITEKAIKEDPLFRQYYLGKNDAELDKTDLEYRIKLLEKKMSDFKVSENYHEVKTEADEKSYEKRQLENKRVLINNYIRNIENSERETEDINLEKMIKVYQAAQVEIPEMVKKSLVEVTNFHKELLDSRNVRLSKELFRQKKLLKEIDNQILTIGERMDVLLEYLNSHGALEEYVALTKELNDLKNEIARINEYQHILKTYHDTQIEIKMSMMDKDKEADLYLEENNKYLDNLREKFQEYAKCFYPNKKSGLVIKNKTGDNKLRYTIEARIEDDSSDGVNEVRMFCFDWLLLNCKVSKIRFIAHDSRLYANMDPRQREALFEIVHEGCKNEDLQYICSINEDALLSFKPMMKEVTYKKIIQDNIIMELNDDDPDSKLLGIQIDIDLEDKRK